MHAAKEAARNLGPALRSGQPGERAARMRNDLQKTIARRDHVLLLDLLAICAEARLNEDEAVQLDIRTHSDIMRTTLLEFPLRHAEQWQALQRSWEEGDQVPATRSDQTHDNHGNADATSSGGWQWGDPTQPRGTPGQRGELHYPQTRYEPQRDTHGWIILDADAKKNALDFIGKHLTRPSQLPEKTRISMARQIREGRPGIWNKDLGVTSLSQQGAYLRMQLGGIAYMLVLIELPS